MSAKGAKLARQQKEESKRRELAAVWEENRRNAEALANANWEELDLELRVISIWYRKRSYEEVMPLERFIEEGIEQWRQEQPIVVSGMYSDEAKVSHEYKQKFVEYFRACNRNAFQDLKALKPIFERAFGSERNSFLKVLDSDIPSKLVQTDYRLDTYISIAITNLFQRTEIERPNIDVRPNKFAQQDFTYKWGNFRLLLDLGFLEVLRRGSRDSALRLEHASQLMKDALRLIDANDRDPELNRALEKLGRLVIEEILSNDPHLVSDVRRILGQFVVTESDEKIDHLIEFLVSIMDWSGNHRIRKDWLLRYGCWFLNQEVHETDTDMFACTVPIFNSRTLYTEKFEFKFEEWFPGDERKEDYEARINSAFREALFNFFQTNGRQLNLDRSKDDRVKGVTRPVDPQYESIKWLIAWNEGATHKQIAHVFCRAERTIIKAIQSLKEFNLPVREGKRGKRSGPLVPESRLREILEKEI